MGCYVFGYEAQANSLRRVQGAQFQVMDNVANCSEVFITQ